MSKTMDETAFLNFLERQLELEELSMDNTLADLEQWDSLAMVMFVANVDADFNVQVDGNAVARAETVRDLYKLLQ